MTGPLREAADSRAADGLARWGLTARGVIYLLIGLLAIDVAAGRGNHETDQRGALNEVARHPGGKILLLLIAIGFIAYALWRFSEAAFGVRGDSGRGPRVKSAFRGVAYAFFAVVAISVLTGSGRGTSQAAQQQDLSARVMQHDGGRLLVGAIGVIVVGIGLLMAADGITRNFRKTLMVEQMSRRTRRVVTALGVIGSLARGIIVGLAGVLTVSAAVTFNSERSRGIDGALRTLAGEPYGTWLLSAAAAGLIVFGVFGLAQARWQRT